MTGYWSTSGERPGELEMESEKEARHFPRSGRSQEGKRDIAAVFLVYLGCRVIRVILNSGHSKIPPMNGEKPGVTIKSLTLCETLPPSGSITYPPSRVSL